MIYNSNILLILNFLFSPAIIILFVVSKNYEIASYFGLISAFVIFFTQSLSSNKRQMIIISNNLNLLKETISFRRLVSLMILIILFIFLYFINTNKYSILLFLLSTCLCLFWIKEMIITEYELKKKNKIIFFETFLYISFYLSIIFVIYLKKNIYDLEKILVFFLSIFFLLLLQSFKKNKKKDSLFKKNYLSIKIDTSYLSSFSMIFCNLLWRICIFSFTNESKAGLFYAAFSLGSMPSTLFVNTLGPHLVKLKNSDKIFNGFLVIYSVLVCIIIFLFNKYLLINSQKLFIEILSFSLIGSILMLLGQYKRHKILLNFLKKKDKIFLNDAIYSILLFALIPIIYFIGGESFLRTGFFLGSILCLIYYYFLEIYLSNYDKQNI